MEELNHTSVGLEINKKVPLDLQVDRIGSPCNPHSKNQLTGLPNGPKGASSCDDDVFHHLAMQLSLIDNLAHRDGSKPTTPELIHSPTKRYSPDPAALDLTQYSGIAKGVTGTEAASNAFFEYHGAGDDHSPDELLPSETRQRNTSTGELPSVLKATGVCVRLEYPRVKITGEKDMADFAGVSYYKWNVHVCSLMRIDVMYFRIHIAYQNSYVANFKNL